MAQFPPLVLSSSGQIERLQAGDTVLVPAAQKTVTVADSPYTILSTDNYLYVDTSGGAVTIVLPDPTTFGYVKEYHILDTKGTFDTNNLTLSPHGAEKIEGLAANKVFQTAWGGWTVVTNQVDWFVY